VRPWHERFPDIYNDERAYWLDKGFEEADLRRGDPAFTGTITVRMGGTEALEHHTFKLTVRYPPGYPYIPPVVAFIDPPIKRARHQGRDGPPCLFPPSAWTLALPAREMYAAIERWLTYHLANHFPRQLAIYELPEYFGWSSLSVLMTPDVVAHMSAGERGRFSVDEVHGYDLGIIRSVDGTDVGKALGAALVPPRLGPRQRHNGKWYRLNAEPPPMEHTAELLNVLADSGHTVDLGKRPHERELIALAFRDAALDEDRVLLLDVGVASKKTRPSVGKGWAVRAPRLYQVSPEDLYRRLEGVRDVDTLATKHVACFGVGAIGSAIALALTREGIGSLTLCDPDTMRPGNVVRHALDLMSAGQFKAEAVEAAANRISPFVITSPHVNNLTHPEVIATHIRDADLVVAAIGNDETEELLCEVIARSDERPPMLLARTLHGGAAFRVALIVPGTDACVTCLAEYKAESHPNWIDVPADDLPDVFDAGCASASRPGAGLTSQHAAVFTAARCLDVLEGRELDANHWLWVERPIAGAEPRLSAGRTLHAARFTPHRGCTTCGA
jgi:molybdopterin/thiamine biosynthesis adenylyltransferase